MFRFSRWFVVIRFVMLCRGVMDCVVWCGVVVLCVLACIVCGLPYVDAWGFLCLVHLVLLCFVMLWYDSSGVLLCVY